MNFLLTQCQSLKLFCNRNPPIITDSKKRFLVNFLSRKKAVWRRRAPSSACKACCCCRSIKVSLKAPTLNGVLFTCQRHFKRRDGSQKSTFSLRWVTSFKIRAGFRNALLKRCSCWVLPRPPAKRVREDLTDKSEEDTVTLIVMPFPKARFMLLYQNRSAGKTKDVSFYTFIEVPQTLHSNHWNFVECNRPMGRQSSCRSKIKTQSFTLR